MTIFYCGRREMAVDWEVKIADFVVLLGKNAKKVFDTLNSPAASSYNDSISKVAGASTEHADRIIIVR